MARTARVVAVAVPHHVTQRGNNRQLVFTDDADRRFYIERLARRACEKELHILGYCLMPNHVHLVAVPERHDSLARGFGQAHSDYARYFNRRHERSGHLWQNRFYSSPLGGSHLLRAIAYVDRNPVRAGLVERAADFRWSSARAHLVGFDEFGLVDFALWSQVRGASNWEGALADSVAGEAELRRATRSGHPWGDEAFVRAMEARAKRPLRRLKLGRKARAASASQT